MPASDILELADEILKDAAAPPAQREPEITWAGMTPQGGSPAIFNEPLTDAELETGQRRHSALQLADQILNDTEPLDYTLWSAGESAGINPKFRADFAKRYPGADAAKYEPVYRKAVGLSRLARQTIENAADDPEKIDESPLLIVDDNDWPLALDILRNEAARDYERRKDKGADEGTFDQIITHIFRGVEQAKSPINRTLESATAELAPTAAMQESGARESRIAQRRSEIASTIYAARPQGADSKSTFKRGVLGAAESLPLMVSSALASIAAGPEMLIPGLVSRGGAAAFVTTASQMVPHEIIQLKDSGYSTNEAIIGGTISGLVQAAIEGGIKIPGLPKIGTSNVDLIFGRNLRGLLTKKLTEWMASPEIKHLIENFVGENVEELLQSGTDILTRVLLSRLGKSKVPYDAGKAIEEAIAKIPETMVAVGTMMAPGAVANVGGAALQARTSEGPPPSAQQGATTPAPEPAAAPPAGQATAPDAGISQSPAAGDAQGGGTASRTSPERQRVANEIRQSFGEQGGNAIIPIVDAFAKAQGVPADEVYGRLSFEKGGAPGGEALFQFPAWHGSPHRFERFDISKIGSGEGAQAYGWGLYFSSKKEIAEHYKQRLTGNTMQYEDEDINPDALYELVRKEMIDAGVAAESARRVALWVGSDFRSGNTIAEIKQRAARSGDLNKAGQARFDHIVDGLRWAPNYERERYVPQLEGGSRAEGALSRDDQSAVFDISEQLNWINPKKVDSETALTKIKREYKDRLDNAEFVLQKSTQHKDAYAKWVEFTAADERGEVGDKSFTEWMREKYGTQETIGNRTYDYVRDYLDYRRTWLVADAALRLIDSHKIKPKLVGPRGRIYQVNIAPEESQFLDWNKPLSEQSQLVRDALSKIYEPPGTFEVRGTAGMGPLSFRVVGADGVTYGSFATELEAREAKKRLEVAAKHGVRADPTGEAAYRKISNQEAGGATSWDANDEGASKRLLSLGVRGIKYRGDSSGATNYVIFDDSDIVVEQMFQRDAARARGSYEISQSGKVVIRALTDPNASTLPHEVWHAFLDMLPYMNRELYLDARKALGGEQGLTTAHKEKWARAGEAYLRTGEAPIPALRKAFELFKRWLTELYKSIRGTPLANAMNPQLKSVFDRMLSPNSAATEPASKALREALQTSAGVAEWVSENPDDAAAILSQIGQHARPHRGEMGPLKDVFKTQTERTEFGRLLRSAMGAAEPPVRSAAQQEIASGEVQEQARTGLPDGQGQEEEGLLTQTPQRVETPAAPGDVPKPGAAAISEDERKYGGGKIAEARREFNEAVADLARRGVFSNPFADPGSVAAALRLAKASLKLGFVHFQEFVADVVEQLGRPLTQRARKLLADAWNSERDANPHIDVADESEVEPTSIKNAVVDKEREARGLPPAMEPARRSFGDVWDETMQRVEENPGVQDNLIAELSEKPRAVDDREDALLLHRQVELQNAYDKTLLELVEARKSGDAEQIAVAARAEAALGKQLEQLYDVNKAVGTATGRGLNARKMLATELFTMARMSEQLRQATESKSLAPEQQQQVVDAHEKVVTAEQKAVAAEQSGVETGRQKQLDLGIGELKAEAKKPRKPRKPRAPAADESEETADDARAIALEVIRGGETDREKIVDAVHEKLKETQPDITRDQVMDAISLYGQFRPLDKEAAKVRLREVSTEMQQLAKLRDLEARIPLAKTGQERQAMTDEARRLMKLVNDAKKKYGVVTTDPARQLKSALDAVKTRLTNQIADLTRQIESGQKDVKAPSSLKYDAAAETLVAQRDALKEQFDAIFGKPEMSDEQRLSQATTAVEKSIANWEKRIADRQVIQERVKPKDGDKSGVTSPELDALRARRDALKDEYAYLESLAKPTKVKRTPEEVALAALKSRMSKRIADLRARIANNDFSPLTKPRKVVLDPEAQKLRFEAEKAKAEWLAALERERRKNRSLKRTIFEEGVEGISAARAMLTSLDLSAFGRQGGWLALGHPVKAFSAFPQMLKAFASERGAFNAREEIERRENAKSGLYKRAKLALTGVDGKITQQEEAYVSNWAKYIPLVAGSERAYVTFLNRIRADVFDSMVATLGGPDGVSDTEAKAIANYVNVATGRGDFGQFNQASAAFSKIFFSPRFLASRFQLLAGQPLYGGNARTRKLVAQEYGRTLIGLGLLYATAQLALSAFRPKDGEDKYYIGLDPRSADFGKLVLGKTRIDPLMGLSQVATFLTRLATGETVNAYGETRPLRENLRPLEAFRDKPRGDKPGPMDSSTFDVMARFGRTKLNPFVGGMIDLLTGKDAVGNETTPGTAALKSVQPIIIGDVIDAMKEQGVPAGTALTLAAILGIGVQTYEMKVAYPEHFLQIDSRLNPTEWKEGLARAEKAVTASGGVTINDVRYKDAEEYRLAAFSPLFEAATAARPVQKQGESMEHQQKQVEDWERHQSRAVEILKQFGKDELQSMFIRNAMKPTGGKGNKFTPAEKLKLSKLLYEVGEKD